MKPVITEYAVLIYFTEWHHKLSMPSQTNTTSTMTQCNAYWSRMCNAWSDTSAGGQWVNSELAVSGLSVTGVDYLRSSWISARLVCGALADCGMTDQMPEHWKIALHVFACACNIDCSVQPHGRTRRQQHILPQYAVNCHSNWASVINRACVLLLTSLTLTSITIRQDTEWHNRLIEQSLFRKWWK